ncbi:MAG: DUF29 domain-containing protein [Hyphomicrobiales bacterium]|nr:DUF29 domain-containing protein [Hyphomicrobiales bacterium]
MASTKISARSNDLHDTDFYAWTQEQARLLRERRFDDLDLDNLVDEVESVGRSDKRQIESRLEILMAHLLKWKFQPGGRGNSWVATIFEQRQRLIGLVEESPSLREFQRQEVSNSYRAARLLAAKETGIALGVFPDDCPFTPEQVVDLDFLPEDRETE